MYSPHAQKMAAEIMYARQLVYRARTVPLGDLEREVNDYEQMIQTPDKRGFLKRSFDYWFGVDNFRADQYRVNKGILRERTKIM